MESDPKEPDVSQPSSSSPVIPVRFPYPPPPVTGQPWFPPVHQVYYPPPVYGLPSYLSSGDARSIQPGEHQTMRGHAITQVDHHTWQGNQFEAVTDTTSIPDSPQPQEAELHHKWHGNEVQAVANTNSSAHPQQEADDLTWRGHSNQFQAEAGTIIPDGLQPQQADLHHMWHGNEVQAVANTSSSAHPQQQEADDLTCRGHFNQFQAETGTIIPDGLQLQQADLHHMWQRNEVQAVANTNSSAYPQRPKADHLTWRGHSNQFQAVADTITIIPNRLQQQAEHHHMWQRSEFRAVANSNSSAYPQRPKAEHLTWRGHSNQFQAVADTITIIPNRPQQQAEHHHMCHGNQFEAGNCRTMPLPQLGAQQRHGRHLRDDWGMHSMQPQCHERTDQPSTSKTYTNCMEKPQKKIPSNWRCRDELYSSEDPEGPASSPYQSEPRAMQQQRNLYGDRGEARPAQKLKAICWHEEEERSKASPAVLPLPSSSSSEEESLPWNKKRKVQKKRLSLQHHHEDYGDEGDVDDPAPVMRRGPGRPRKDGLPPRQRKQKDTQCIPDENKEAEETDDDANFNEPKLNDGETDNVILNETKLNEVKTDSDANLDESNLATPSEAQPDKGIQTNMNVISSEQPISRDDPIIITDSDDDDNTLKDSLPSQPVFDSDDNDTLEDSLPAQPVFAGVFSLRAAGISAHLQEIECCHCYLDIDEFRPPGSLRTCKKHRDPIHFSCLQECVRKFNKCPQCNCAAKEADLE